MNVEELMKVVNESYEKNMNTKFVFGEAVVKDNITVIPVSKVAAKVGEGNSFLFNIGSHHYSGKNENDDFLKSGDTAPEDKNIQKGGYGIETRMTPIGFIEIKNGKAEFKAIMDIGRIAMMGICYAGFFVFMVTRMITKIAKIQTKNKCNCDCRDEKK